MPTSPGGGQLHPVPVGTPPPHPVIPAKAATPRHSGESRHPSSFRRNPPPPPSFRRKPKPTSPPGVRLPASCHRHRHPPSFRHHPRLSGESRNPRRLSTLRDSASTPHCGHPLRQPKRAGDVDPGFRRGDGVGPSGRRSKAMTPIPSFGRKPEPTSPPGVRTPASCRRHRRHLRSFRRKPESTSPPGVRLPAGWRRRRHPIPVIRRNDDITAKAKVACPQSPG